MCLSLKAYTGWTLPITGDLSTSLQLKDVTWNGVDKPITNGERTDDNVTSN